MFPKSYLLLQNEGALMQGCFESCFATLRIGEDADRSHLYSASFQYSIGLERLLKIILAMDEWHQNRTFPNAKEFKGYGHNISELYERNTKLFPNYKIQRPKPDPINQELVSFLTTFANGSRYFNLDTLSAPAKAADPIERLETLLERVYEEDHESRNMSGPSGSADHFKADTEDEDSDEFHEDILHQVVIAAALPHLSWRLIQLLIPQRELLVAVRKQIQQDDFLKDGQRADPSVPFMEEFLNFVCEEKNIILNSQDWP